MSRERKLFYVYSTNAFEVTVQDCRWLIKLGTDDVNLYDSRTVSSDGESTYLLLNYETRFQANIAKHLPNGANVGDGAVIRGTLPCFSEAEEAGGIWIAYASDCYFGEHAKDKKIALPFALYVRSDPIMAGEGQAVEPAVIALSKEHPSVPESLVYYMKDPSEGGYKIADGAGANNPFTNVVFKATSFTNVNGLRLCQDASVSIFRPWSRTNSEMELQLCNQYRFIATNITFGVPLATFQPELPGKTIVNEQRFNNGTGLRLAYFVETRWLSEAEVRASKDYKTALATVIPIKKTKSNSRAVTLIFVTLMILPVAWWFISRMKHARDTVKQ